MEKTDTIIYLKKKKETKTKRISKKNIVRLKSPKILIDKIVSF